MLIVEQPLPCVRMPLLQRRVVIGGRVRYAQPLREFVLQLLCHVSQHGYLGTVGDKWQEGLRSVSICSRSMPVQSRSLFAVTVFNSS
jgi:hypothetical protein